MTKKCANEFHKAWWDLHQHGIFALCDARLKEYGDFPTSMFHRCLDVFVAKVHPRTLRVEQKARKNTKVQVWLEAGPWWLPSKKDIKAGHAPEGMPSHDYRLDCGADTYEEAIIKLRNLVWKYYGKKAKPRTIPNPKVKMPKRPPWVHAKA